MSQADGSVLINTEIDSAKYKKSLGDMKSATDSWAKGTSADFNAVQKSSLGLSSAILRMSAAFAGLAIAGGIKRAIESASQYNALGVAVRKIGENAGYSAAEVDKQVNALRRMGVAGTEARQAMMRLIQSQVDITKSSKLARVAQDAAVIGAINSSQAFDRLVHGIQGAQTNVLRTIGINVNFEQSYQNLAASLGKATESLTEQEKTQARVNAVLAEGEKIAGTYEKAISAAGKQINSLSRIHQDFATDFGKFFTDFGNYTGVISEYSKVLEGWNAIALASRGLMSGMSLDEVLVGAKNLQEYRERIEEAVAATKEFESTMELLDATAKQGIDAGALIREAEDLKNKFDGGTLSVDRFRRALAELGVIARSTLAHASISVDDAAKYFMFNGVAESVEEQTARINAAFAKTGDESKRLKTQALKDDQDRIKSLVKIGAMTEAQGKERISAFEKEIASLNKKTSPSAGTPTSEVIRGITQQIEALNATDMTFVERLDKGLADIAEKGRKAKIDVSELQAQFTKGMGDKYVSDFNKKIADMVGGSEAAAFKQEELAKELDGVEQAFLRITGSADQATAARSRYQEASEREIRKENLETQVGFLKEIESLSGQYGISLQAQNDLLEMQATLYRSTLPESMQPFIDQWLKLKQQENDPSFGAGIERSAQKFVTEWTDAGKVAEKQFDVMIGAVQQLGSAAVDAIFGDAEFRADQFFKDIAKQLLQIAMNQMIAGVFKYFGFGVGTAHTGGIAGVPDTNASRNVSPAAFAYAPRFHAGGIAGLRNNEIPAILQRGEGIFTQAQMRALSPVGAGGNYVYSPNIEINYTGSASSTPEIDMQKIGEQLNSQLRKGFESMIDQRMITQSRPGGLLNRGIQ